MKRQITVLSSIVAAVVVLMATSASAFTPGRSEQFRAEANTLGVSTATFNVNVRPAASPEVPIDVPSINWVNVQPGSGWQVAQSVLRITWDVTDPLGGIQIYTDNTGLGTGVVPNPKFLDPTAGDPTNGDSNPAGLLLVDGPETGTTLPVAWSIKGTSFTVIPEAPVPPIAANPTHTGLDPDGTPNPAVPEDVNAFQWLFLADHETPAIASSNTSAFVDGDPFVTMIKLQGIHFGQAPGEFAADDDKTAYVFFQADFTTAGAQAQYRTDALTVEAFVD